MNLQLALLLGYSALLIGLGLWIGRRVSGTKDFFVAGRKLGPGLIFSTMLAANIGGGSTVGATGLGYSGGVAAWWWVGSAALGSAILAFWIGPAIRREAAAHDLRTVGDYLEYRYGPTVRALIAALLWVGALFILVTIFLPRGLMGLVPGLRPRQIDATCCGVAGTYGLKREKYDIAMAVGEAVFQGVREGGAELSACDSETCRWWISEATGRPSVHPIELLRRSYRLSGD